MCENFSNADWLWLVVENTGVRVDVSKTFWADNWQPIISHTFHVKWLLQELMASM